MGKLMMPVAAFLGLLLAGLAVEARAATTGATPPATATKKPPPPPLKWLELEAGQGEAKGASKPLLVLFVVKDFKGFPNFDDPAVRQAMTDAGVILARVLPPEAPKSARNASVADVKNLQNAYTEAQKKYQDLLAKYNVTVKPTVLFLNADGDPVSMVATPTNEQLIQALANLPRILEAFKAAKARAAAQAQPPAAKPAEKPAENK